MGILIVVSIIISLVYLVWMRKYLLETAILLDSKTITPSDYCLMGFDMSFEDCTQDGIELEVREAFHRDFNLEVEYVNATYNIKDFYK